MPFEDLERYEQILRINSQARGDQDPVLVAQIVPNLPDGDIYDKRREKQQEQLGSEQPPRAESLLHQSMPWNH